MTHIAVIDIGKTNAKLALVEADTLREVAVVTRPNRVLAGPPYPHVDLDGHWAFFAQNLREFARQGVSSVSITTHGAAAVLLDAQGGLACPMLDYEHDGPDTMAAEYDALRPDFAQTGSPRLPLGLNLGAQLHWLLARDPSLGGRVAQVLTYPQYWGFRLTGERACDLSSLGCHTDLWNPFEARFSDLVERLGLGGRIAPARASAEILGFVTAQAAAETGLLPGTPVTVGIHDSNASLAPYLLTRDAPFSVVSTGTWVVAMAVGARAQPLDPARDVLVNVSARGAAVPSARFMGGREFERINAGAEVTPSPEDRAAVLARGVRLLPAVESGSGPFKGRAHAWTTPPQTAGEMRVALSYYLALMTETCLSLTGAQGPVIVEGPFARNADYLAMLRAGRAVETAASATGTAAGAALLAQNAPRAPQTTPLPLPAEAEALSAYAALWRADL